MSKKLFQKLIKLASTPVPKEQDKQLMPKVKHENVQKVPKRKTAK